MKRLGPKDGEERKKVGSLDWTSPLGRWLSQFLKGKVGHSRGTDRWLVGVERKLTGPSPELRPREYREG